MARLITNFEELRDVGWVPSTMEHLTLRAIEDEYDEWEKQNDNIFKDIPEGELRRMHFLLEELEYLFQKNNTLHREAADLRVLQHQMSPILERMDKVEDIQIEIVKQLKDDT